MKTKYTFTFNGIIEFLQDDITIDNKKVQSYSEKQAKYLLAKELFENNYQFKRTLLEYFSAINRAVTRRRLHISVTR